MGDDVKLLQILWKPSLEELLEVEIDTESTLQDLYDALVDFEDLEGREWNFCEEDETLIESARYGNIFAFDRSVLYIKEVLKSAPEAPGAGPEPEEKPVRVSWLIGEVGVVELDIDAESTLEDLYGALEDFEPLQGKNWGFVHENKLVPESGMRLHKPYAMGDTIYIVEIDASGEGIFKLPEPNQETPLPAANPSPSPSPPETVENSENTSKSVENTDSATKPTNRRKKGRETSILGVEEEEARALYGLSTQVKQESRDSEMLSRLSTVEQKVIDVRGMVNSVMQTLSDLKSSSQEISETSQKTHSLCKEDEKWKRQVRSDLDSLKTSVETILVGLAQGVSGVKVVDEEAQKESERIQTDAVMKVRHEMNDLQAGMVAMENEMKDISGVLNFVAKMMKDTEAKREADAIRQVETLRQLEEMKASNAAILSSSLNRKRSSEKAVPLSVDPPASPPLNGRKVKPMTLGKRLPTPGQKKKPVSAEMFQEPENPVASIGSSEDPRIGKVCFVRSTFRGSKSKGTITVRKGTRLRVISEDDKYFEVSKIPSGQVGKVPKSSVGEEVVVAHVRVGLAGEMCSRAGQCAGETRTDFKTFQRTDCECM